MAITLNAHSMKAKFPEFSSLSDTTIESAIEEAALFVDYTWDKYQLLGWMYLTAHYLMVTLANAESATGQVIESESFAGMMSVTYKAGETKPSYDNEDSTPYGVRFKALRDGQFPAVMVI